MKKNVGNPDRIIRVILAIVLAVLYFTGVISGTLGLVLVIAGGVFLATSFVSFCPIYAVLGKSTCAIKK
ncbi:DUF2892 domain-containing protein [uncultured Polaribacter sp.]|uniref:YgaP family membrane protein n=1 Tax=uncultured Polaribacter sp. TaxID=174711 RepID=UPI00261A5173|nr:DUF2892 domain-containing protein [uncultured Polaribacter sp.]